MDGLSCFFKKHAAELPYGLLAPAIQNWAYLLKYRPFTNQVILEELFLKEAFKLVLQAFKKIFI